ncbi:hypothetical protein HPP92_001539 [Vanilla planifolia]|uniref:UBC core domain-containing protein n=1 Tax=Vanilla planifolia TaxID=51239 RepID=A0A835SD29_VANPL|nr:hypothetical protein HPP92_001539 [Vanilla planifolia]
MTRESHDVHRNIPGAAAVASPPPSPAAGGKQTQPVAKGNESQSVLKRLQSELMALMANYPFKPPKVKFENPCFHPNVDLCGNICLDILQDKWSSAYDVRTVLISIQSLLGEPNNESPLNTQAAALWGNQEEFKKVVESSTSLRD